jgi:tetratricopeptide (TPR) repeat protein
MTGKNSHNRSVLAGLIFCLLAAAAAIPPAIGQDHNVAIPQTVDPANEKKLALAEGYHDLAVLYIKRGDVDKGLAQAREIVRLHLTGDFEKPWVQSLSIICEKLAEAKRFDGAQALLDEALRLADTNATRVKILRNKARLFVLSGENDRAIDSWNRALELESRRGR